jgi:hypothetical protein
MFMNKTFSICPKCNKNWASRDEFLSDRDITMRGYQVNFEKLELGLFLFNHNCKTTLAIHANKFTDMYDGEIFRYERKTGTDSCPGYCLLKESLQACPAACECAYVRSIAAKIANILKSNVPKSNS